MANSATTARAEAIRGFAAVLSQLRDSAGRPSFRVMAGRSRAISHTTLHEAVQGHRLPSWGTTAQFVQACGADPADYRERWEQADRVVGSAGAASAAASAASAVADPAARAVGAAGGARHRAEVDVPVDRPSQAPDGLREEPAPAGAPAADAEQQPRRRRRGWYAVVGAAAAGVLATGGVVAWAQVGDDRPTPPVESTPPVRAQHAARDCPVQQKNPPTQPPEHKGDGAAFVSDVTLPDCTRVGRGRTVVKVWRLKNTGVVPWSGYTLHRIDIPQTRDQCQTITDVPIPDTPPGALVDVKVEVTTPSGSAFCFVRFKLVDAQGKVAFPGNRPVNFQVVVG